jgi:hypothetical protein
MEKISTLDLIKNLDEKGEIVSKLDMEYRSERALISKVTIYKGLLSVIALLVAMLAIAVFTSSINPWYKTYLRG